MNNTVLDLREEDNLSLGLFNVQKNMEWRHGFMFKKIRQTSNGKKIYPK